MSSINVTARRSCSALTPATPETSIGWVGSHGRGHANAAGAAANRVALEACVEARNQGRQLEKEGKDILTAAAKSSPELATAMETWKEIKFEFDTVDKLDVQHR